VTFEVFIVITVKTAVLQYVVKSGMSLLISEESSASLLLFYLEDGGRRFLRNIYNDLPNYMASHFRRQ
jgi:hypothetical protein